MRQLTRCMMGAACAFLVTQTHGYDERTHQFLSREAALNSVLSTAVLTDLVSGAARLCASALSAVCDKRSEGSSSGARVQGSLAAALVTQIVPDR
jgi:hypothetical protein